MPPREVARQFEAVLVRQMMQETMKPLLENGHSGQVYGYFIADALSESFTKAGGFGLQSVLEAQLFAQRSREQSAAEAGASVLPPAPAAKEAPSKKGAPR
jgi:Rod binding domain-containing protein